MLIFLTLISKYTDPVIDEPCRISPKTEAQTSMLPSGRQSFLAESSDPRDTDVSLNYEQFKLWGKTRSDQASRLDMLY